MKNLYDLTNSQKSIWLTEQYYKNTNINNVCGVYLSSVPLDYKILEKALKLFVKNNDSYQIRLKLENGVVKQYFEDYKDFPIETVCVQSEKDFQDLQEKENAQGFNLLNSRLFNIIMFKFPDEHGGFIINSNHIIADSWASGLLANGLSKIYTDLKNGNDDVNFQTYSYKDYIKTEQEYINSDKFQKDKTYWDSMFSEVPEIASIPSINSTSNNVSHKASRLSKDIDSKVFQSIKNFTQENKISIYNLFMSIYALYLRKVSHTKNFVIGTPILNRTNFKEKQTTGMFINVLPLKFEIQDNMCFSNFVSQVSTNSTSLLRHQRYSYNYILEDLRKKDSSIPGLYNILFSYQITKMNENNDILPHKTSWIFNKSILNDMEIHIFEWNEQNTLQVAYDYKIDKYSESEIEVMHKRILHILNQIISKPDILLKDITIIPEDELKILNSFNNTNVEYSKNKTIVNLFEEQVKKSPNDIALVFENDSLTFDELNKRANSLAYYLRNSKNIKNNDLVGIMVNRSLEMIISILAVLKAGGAYIPIDPTYPEDRIQYMLKNSEAKVLLTQKKLDDKVEFSNKVFTELDNAIYSSNSSNLETINKPDDLSYVIFTSGSTGLPKGVMLKHKALSNLANYCNHYIEYLKNPSHQSVVSITTVSFDIFIFETLISLQKGLKLVIANEKEQTDPNLLNKLIEKEDVTIIQSTPSRMQLLVNNIDKIPHLKNLKYITLAGEQLPLHLVNSLNKICDCTIYNGYGPSETTVFSTLTKMNNSEITIGKPLDNTQIYILDDNQNLLPIGVAGEIYISGDGVGKGYLNNKELTDKSFIKNKFIPNTIMYKTGDIGIYNPNGNITCLGRVDHQVKIRGLRIELGEIEDKILELSEIHSCVVVKKLDENSHEFLCAYYTSKESIKADKIRKHLEKFLPTYMVPQYFVELESLPYTPNGKIDRKKLPEPKYEVKYKQIILPRNEIDNELIKLIKSQFNISEVSMDDSFFDLGGDSLYAINLSIQIQNKFNVEIFSRDIIENPIIQDLSDVISKKAKNGNVIALEKIPEAEFYPLSSAQKRIYYASKVAGENNILYNIPGSIIIKGNVDFERLEKAFKDLINRHESLRTKFVIHEEDIATQIIPSVDFKLEIEKHADLKNFTNIYKKFIKPFNLSEAPLFRAKLIKFTNDESAILVDMHHIIADGASLSILAEELMNLYNNNSLEDLEITYKDFTAYEEKYLKTDSFKEAENYWLNEFKTDDEIPVLNLPTTYPRPAVQSFEGKKIYSSINSETLEKINDLAKSLDVTPYMILLSCYYILLSKYTSRKRYNCWFANYRKRQNRTAKNNWYVC